MKTQIQLSTKNIITIATGVVVIVIMLFLGITLLTGGNTPSVQPSQANISLQDGKQIISLTATPGAYTPSASLAKANKDSILRVASNNNYGCTSSLRIPQLKVTQVLNNGTTDISIAAQAPGTEIDGICSMGMYHFKIQFS